jgi:hypothetical protein
MKIYLVVEEYKQVKSVITCWEDYDRVDYSYEGAKKLCDRWNEAYPHIKYSIKEVEL